ncbi:MAG: GGDEF domain-containing protein [Gammaproteobacteria bacterium]|nr:GGDEF domain-containing protein [Gammaproteobacteria bacterium]MBU0814563.1 GGDEF domain-containing protein [Gammaproteobacteria bacterium]MBU1786594.1 GGDEF domain-containing protein [Gammaproteobacteria bacterium]
MNSLDPRTIILLTGVMGGVMSLVMYMMRRNFPPNIKGLTAWAASPFILFIAAILGGSRGLLPEFLSIVLPNILLFVGIYVAYFGSQQFFGVAPALRRWVMALIPVAAVAIWFTLIQPDYRTRLMLLSPSLGLVFAMHAHLIYTKAPRTFASWLSFVVLLSAVAIQIMRFLLAWQSRNETGVYDLNSPQAYFLAAYSFVILLFNVGLLLMATECLRTEFEHQATHDSLTDAFTRRHMNEACAQELERCRRHGHVMALLIMDLDHFKAINDTYGHQRGDRVLVEFATQVKTLLRRQDQLGRFGGEEFVLLLPETPLPVATVVAERIRAMVDESSDNPHYTVSIGLTINQHDYDSLDTLLARADTALYRAKEKGRNRVESA